MFVAVCIYGATKNYCSDDSSSEETTSSSTNDSLTAKDIRSVYLVTYSQADIVKFSSREDFPLAVLASFSQGKAQVLQWCCCRERKNSGDHYHLALKLDRNQHWLSAKEFLQREYGISVHFSNKHQNYYNSAWRYVTKSDPDYTESTNHPYLGDKSEPKTSSASRRRCQRIAKRSLPIEDREESGLEDEEHEVVSKSKSSPSKRKKK